MEAAAPRPFALALPADGVSARPAAGRLNAALIGVSGTRSRSRVSTVLPIALGAVQAAIRSCWVQSFPCCADLVVQLRGLVAELQLFLPELEHDRREQQAADDAEDELDHDVPYHRGAGRFLNKARATREPRP